MDTVVDFEKYNLDTLIALAKNKYFNVDTDKIKRAYNFVCDAHKDRLRKSGNTVVEHCLGTAILLVKYMQADEASIIAALLHNVYDAGNEYDHKVVKTEFGKTVAEIVDNVYRIQSLEELNTNDSTDDHNKVESYRRLLLSLFSDVRILFVKIADILQNLQTIALISPESQLRLAKEVLYVYTPFVNRMGLHDIKWQFEDIAFSVINPEAYKHIEEKLAASKEERDQYIKDTIEPINNKLKNDSIVISTGMKWKVYGRAKHIYSIHNKMLNRGVPFEKLYDIFALRVVIDTDNPTLCHYVYGLVCSIYPPAPETFKDYISSPKKNGYQSIHTGVVGKDNKVIEVQFRTEIMHFACEHGVAAHFRYKNNAVTNDSVFEMAEVSNWLTEVRDVFESIENQSFDEVLENVNRNLFMDDIYLLTPKNDYVSLPRDSVPLDYAFKIHSDIGRRYIGAKVNSRIVPVDYKLQSGDRCEILLSENAVPHKDWLQIVVTPRAKNYIAKRLKEIEKQKIADATRLWEASIQKRGLKISEKEYKIIAKGFNYESVDAFMLAIADDEIEILKAIDYAFYRMSTYAYPVKGRGKESEVAKDEQEEREILDFQVHVAQKQPALNEILMLIINSRTVIIRSLEVKLEQGILIFDFTIVSNSKENLNELFKHIENTTDVKSLIKSD